LSVGETSGCEDRGTATAGGVSVVICAYDSGRLEQLRAAVASVQRQSVPPLELIVVVDNNPELLGRVRAELPAVTSLELTGPRGAGSARNLGVAAASGAVVAFIDDDALAFRDWIERALAWFSEPQVIGVGGAIHPAWEQRPRWMAEEFHWTVGCTYPGLPTRAAPVRNLIATNMFLRREAFVELAGFREDFGKTGTRSGTEETDLCIRASQRWPGKVWLYDPSVAVTHRVPRARSTVRYFLSRCYDEGVAKAAIVGFLGGHDGLSAERAYTRSTLPRGLARALGASVRERDGWGLARAMSIAAGLAAAAVGYAAGRAPLLGGRRPPYKRDGVVVVGSGTHFISGVSHYTRYLAVALSEQTPTAAILMRRLIPRRLYPGRARVGAVLTEEAYPPSVHVYDGVDWYWIPTILGAVRLLIRRRPRALLLQWWTGAVLHTYLLLALVGRLLGARIVIEVHELQDTGEAGLAPARVYVRRFGRVLMGLADAYLVHSEFDRVALQRSFEIGSRQVEVVRHGPFSHYAVADTPPRREAGAGDCNVLFFGTIRPYKGLEDLVLAFETLAEEDPRWWLTVVGETWEEWTRPLELIEGSRHRDRITLVNRYVSDAEASAWFAGADVVALPYRRSSASGPLHLTMDAGLPVVVTDVGGLEEAARGYRGAVLVASESPAALAQGLREARSLCGTRFEDAGSWEENAAAVLRLVEDLSDRDPVLSGT
jgi:glycosyltransferase involved in cell wall biosynthesis